MNPTGDPKRSFEDYQIATDTATALMFGTEEERQLEAYLGRVESVEPDDREIARLLELAR